jgi:hypothetical protein
MGELAMKNQEEARAKSIFPQRIRTYLTLNISLAVMMALVMAVRAELKAGRFLVIDYLLFCFYTLMLCVIFFAPLGVVENYLYHRKKGVLYAWKNRTNNRGRERTRMLEERTHWKSEAVRARWSRGDRAADGRTNRTGLLATRNVADGVSRASLLMTVADGFEQAGKREAAARCYQQITQRFADSPQAAEAARRLSSSASSI